MNAINRLLPTMEPETKVSLAKAFSLWLLVGVSQMTPLQAVQFVAAIGASIWSFILIGDWLWKKWRSRNETNP